MKKKLALMCIAACLLSPTAYATDLSEWAVESYENLSKGGILTYDVVSGNLKGSITRREVSAMLVNLYQKLTTKEIPETTHSFSDTDDEFVQKAYAAGIVSGKSAEIFDPEAFVTRQEFAKMVLNTFNSADINFTIDETVINEAMEPFSDKGEIADWAIEAMVVAVKSGIINGTSDTTVSPKGSATREQAICMVSRVYDQFGKNKMTYARPELSSNGVRSSGDMDFAWAGPMDATKYTVLIKDKEAQVMEAFEIASNYTTIYSIDYTTGIYTITLGAENSQGIQTYSTPIDFTFTEPVYEYVEVSLNDKEQRVFPDGHAFTSKDEASAYMTTITVPVWRMKSNGEKYSANAHLTVNQALAEDVLNIFTEIYNSPEQFPIKSVGGYNWRNTASGKLSQHSYGTCIDINPNENYYVEPDGTPITGNYWKPYEDPYSIPEDGVVVKTFAKYGWEWGGNCWSDKYAKDYMHFTFLGK